MRVRNALDDWWHGALACLTTVAYLAACDSKPKPVATIDVAPASAAGAAGSGTGGSGTGRSGAAGSTSGAPGAEEANTAPALVPTWALGSWRGQGSSTVTALQLPNNQGVQIGWLKDKGTRYVGALA